MALINKNTEEWMKGRVAYYTPFEKEVIRFYGTLWPSKEKVLAVWSKSIIGAKKRRCHP